MAKILGPDGPSLEELGIGKNLAKQARKLARMPKAEFEAKFSHVTDKQQGPEEPTPSRDTDAVDSFFPKAATFGSAGHGRCECGRQDYLMPLHGERGGRLLCLICRGAWDAKYGKLERVDGPIKRR
jgi:hypothetical protein